MAVKRITSAKTAMVVTSVTIYENNAESRGGSSKINWPNVLCLLSKGPICLYIKICLQIVLDISVNIFYEDDYCKKEKIRSFSHN